MTSSEAFVKIQYGLNKLGSADYPNLEPSQVMYATNSEIKLWVRRQLRGSNIFKDGKEQSTRRVDDLQVLLVDKKLQGNMKPSYFETAPLPKDFLEQNRLSPLATKDKCDKVIVSHLIEEGNVSEYLSSWDKQPSFDFEETFHTSKGNRLYVFHNGDFDINHCILTYYRQPKYIQYEGAYLPDGSIGVDMEWEFKDDVCELIIKDIIAALASSIESVNSYQINNQEAEQSN